MMFISFSIFLQYWIGSVLTTKAYGPNNLRITPMAVELVSEPNEIINDLMISPYDMEIIIYSSVIGQYSSVKATSHDIQPFYIFEPFSEFGNQTETLTIASIEKVVVSGSNRSSFIFDNASYPSPTLLLSVQSHTATGGNVTITLKHSYNITAVLIFGLNRNGNRVAREIYNLYATMSLHIPSGGWTLKALYRSHFGSTAFVIGQALRPFIAKQLMIASITTLPLYISKLEIFGQRSSVGMSQWITHCGPNHHYYYFASGQCLSRRPVNADPTADPEVIVGECFKDNPITVNGDVASARFELITGLVCDEHSKLMYLSDGTFFRKFDLTSQELTTIYNADPCELQNGYFYHPPSLYCTKHGLSRIKYYRFSSPSSHSRIDTDRNQATQAGSYVDWDFRTQATFTAMYSMTYLMEDIIIVADKYNNVLRIIKGFPEDNIATVFSVCSYKATYNDTSLRMSPIEKTYRNCDLHKPRLIRSYKMKLAVIDSLISGQQRVTSYKCCELTSVPTPGINQTDSTLRWSADDHCPTAHLTITAKSLFTTNSTTTVTFNISGGMAIAQLTQIRTLPDEPIILSVRNQNNLSITSPNIIWPPINAKLRASLTITNGSYSQTVHVAQDDIFADNKATVRDGERYNITCEITTQFPVVSVQIKILIECQNKTDTLSMTSTSQSPDLFNRRTFKHSASISQYRFYQQATPVSTSIYFEVSWKSIHNNASISSDLRKRVFKSGVMYIRVYKENCFVRSLIIEDVGSRNNWIPSYHLESGHNFATVEINCSEGEMRAENSYCYGNCSSCDQYCHFSDGYEVTPTLDHQTYTLSWPTFSDCFQNYSVTACLLESQTVCKEKRHVAASSGDLTASIQLNVNGWLHTGINAVWVTLEGLLAHGNKTVQNLTPVIYPYNEDIADLEIKINSVHGEITASYSPQLKAYVGVVRNTDSLNVQCQISAPHPLRSPGQLEMFTGCSAVKFNSYQIHSKPGITGTIYTHYRNITGVPANLSQTTFAEYLPIMCQWEWPAVNETAFNLQKASILYLKVINEKHNMSISDSKVIPDWFFLVENNVTSNAYLSQCNESSKNFSDQYCANKVCTVCEKNYMRCLHGSICDEQQITCDCRTAPGYQGPRCEEAQGLCGSGKLQCLFGGTCTESTNPPSCICPAGYSGVTCAVSDKCKPNPCEHKWLICEIDASPSNPKGYICKENNFIDDQIKTKSDCSQDTSVCAVSLKNSECHPLGFCFCPDGTVKTNVQLENGTSEEKCMAGKVKCRNQIDCVWVSDDLGETVCYDNTADNKNIEMSTCNCFDLARANNITGRCLRLQTQSEAKEKWTKLIPWWGYLLGTIMLLILLFMTVGTVWAYRNQCVTKIRKVKTLATGSFDRHLDAQESKPNRNARKQSGERKINNVSSTQESKLKQRPSPIKAAKSPSKGSSTSIQREPETLPILALPEFKSKNLPKTRQKIKKSASERKPKRKNSINKTISATRPLALVDRAKIENSKTDQLKKKSSKSQRKVKGLNNTETEEERSE